MFKWISSTQVVDFVPHCVLIKLLLCYTKGKQAGDLTNKRMPHIEPNSTIIYIFFDSLDYVKDIDERAALLLTHDT
jgi:hypothetical protein